MPLLSSRNETTVCEATDYFYKTNATNSNDNKIQRDNIFGQGLTPTSDVQFNIITATNLGGGTYTPVVLSTSGPIAGELVSTNQYMSYGDVCFVSGQIAIQPTSATGNIDVVLGIPISSNFPDDQELTGAVTIENGQAELIMTTKHVASEPALNAARFRFFKSTNYSSSFTAHYTYMYKII